MLIPLHSTFYWKKWDGIETSYELGHNITINFRYISSVLCYPYDGMGLLAKTIEL